MAMDFWVILASSIAVLIVGISKGGFGGGLGMLGVPVMSLAMSPIQAAAILLPVLCVMDLMALKAYWGRWSRLHVLRLIPAAIAGILVGALTFKYFNPQYIRLVIGLIAVGFALNYWFKPARHWVKNKPGVKSGLFWGGIAGFTSFVAHAGGPPVSVYLLPQKLEKSIYQASSVAFFTTVNYVKLVPYTLLGQFNTTNLLASLWLVPIAALGIWLGITLHKRVSDGLFFQIAYVFLFITGLKLLYDGSAGIVH